MPYGLSPQEFRAKLVASYRESYRRAQIHMTDLEVERQVVADCELVDAARNAGELSDPSPKPRTAAPPPRPDVVANAHRTSGTRPANGEKERPRHLYQNPLKVTERWAYACARIARITEGAGGAATIDGAAANAEVPRLAKEYAELWAYYLTRTKPPPATGIDHNPFRGLSPAEAARMFMRKVEDICDRSTRELGHWYVK